MPLYDFSCDSCGERFETLVRRESDAATVTCPTCDGREVHRQLSLPAAPLTPAAAPAGGACGVGPPCGAPWCQRKG
jgi:putative FmdB family regulatory protein